MTDRELMQQALGCEEVHPECKKTRRRKWVGLTEEEVNQAWRRGQANIGWDNFEIVAREVEAKLREKNA